MSLSSKEIFKHFMQSSYLFLKNTKKVDNIDRKKMIFLRSKNHFNPIDLGNYQIKIAESKKEIKNAQALRYKIFYKEKNAKASFKQKIFKRDFDIHDSVADHLIIIDKCKVCC